MTKSGSNTGEGPLSKRRARFDRWRRGRPFAGGALLILASFVIAWIPIHIAGDTILLGKALSPVGLLFAALVFLCGMFALTRPQLADIFGIFGIVFSIFSLYGALGGFLVGTALGIIGGVLCYAWIDEDDEDGGSGGDTTESEKSGFDFETNTEDDSDGLFGTRSSLDQSLSESAGSRTASLSLLVVTVVVLSVFAHPFVAAVAADSYPAQSGIDGTVVIANQFSGSGYTHENVTTDSSNRKRVPAGQLSFDSASMQGVTIYKNFRTGPETPFHVSITGSSASASNGLSLTVSEFYASELSLSGVVPLARNKWTTCPGQDFLLKNGDIIKPSISGQGVTTNTHQLYASQITIQDLELVVRKGTASTSVTGTPECTTGPVGPVLDLFEASALEALVEQGRLPETVLNNATVANLTAPETVGQNETFEVSAQVTNVGYITDNTTVEYYLDGARRNQTTVTLGPDESTTVTFTDTTDGIEAGSHELSVVAGNDSATTTIVVTEPNTTNGTAVSSPEQNTTRTNVPTTDAMTTRVTPTANDTGGNETTTENQSTETVSEPTPTSAGENTTTETRTVDTDGTLTALPTETPTPTGTPTTTETSVSTASTDQSETTPTATPTTETLTPTEPSTASNTTTSDGPSTESALVGSP